MSLFESQVLHQIGTREKFQHQVNNVFEVSGFYVLGTGRASRCGTLRRHSTGQEALDLTNQIRVRWNAKFAYSNSEAGVLSPCSAL
eukprot:3629264-Pleurochrysis_carterae.AAC.1